MEISSRITKSLFYFLESKQVCIQNTEFTTNTPVSWFDAGTVLPYIQQAQKEYNKIYPKELFYQNWAKASFSLRAWEGLDSVLRIMPFPEPERLTYFLAQFFSYFISPSIELSQLSVKENNFKLKINLSSQDLTEVAKYLSACIACIPCFNKNSTASCIWKDNFLQISFSNKQTSIFGTEELVKTHITPELMSSLLEDFKKKEEGLLIREKILIKKEKQLIKKEKDFLLVFKKNKGILRNSLLNSVGQFFSSKKTKKQKNKNNNLDQFSFDLD